ncbi:GntR family transcriptional regulator [Nocardioides fonticola]|uniref:GntR family transcriptional regulator n=1 Tax=Nocardioides fonticola TaxID=450363 RepID=A0ABP7XB57_9ACTN
MDSAVDAVRRRLAERIAAGSLSPGERLGAERDLAEELGVSRATLRSALAELAATGLVRRTPGRGGGTFVAGKVTRDLSRVVGVPAMLREQGFVAGSRIVAASLRTADDATAAGLGIKTDDLVVELVRVRLADAIPISLEYARFPALRFPDLLEHPLGGSMYALLEQRYGVTPVASVERIEAVEAAPDVAGLLEVEVGSPLLAVTRTTRDADGVAFEHAHDLFRGDRTAITVHTRPDGSTVAGREDVAGGVSRAGRADRP